MLRSLLLSLLALLLLGTTPEIEAQSAVPSAHVAQQSIEQDIERCRQDPRFEIGGAMIGDCLMELSEAVDREISAAVATGEERYCVAEDRADYRQSHADWLAYRQRLCDLVERSPDNTPSWVNSAACRLELGRQRLSSLKYTNEYGSPRCAAEE